MGGLLPQYLGNGNHPNDAGPLIHMLARHFRPVSTFGSPNIPEGTSRFQDNDSIRQPTSKIGMTLREETIIQFLQTCSSCMRKYERV